jgi:immune inhibitor A
MMARAALALAVGLLVQPLFPGWINSLDSSLEGQVPNRPPPQALLQRMENSAQTLDFSRGWKARTAQAMESSEALTGTMPVAIILALFSDSEEPHLGADEVQQAMFDGPSQYGTVSAFYQEVSAGRFSVTGQAFPWVRTNITQAEVVGTEYGLGDDARTGEYLLDALEAADSTVDFGLFDSDGPDGVPNSADDDGIVDAVAFQYLEVAASCGGPSIWPHRWVMEGWTEDEEPFETNDLRPDGTPIVVSDYTTQSATDCGGIEPQKATTIAHELGHVLGLPDLYDRSQGVEPEHRRWVVGCWDLMAAGAWGCGADNRTAWVRPTHMGAWEKVVLGWVDEVEDAGSVLDGTFTLEPVMSGQRVLKISLKPGAPQEEEEYLLLEYRTKEGFDADLPASGVLIYHVDPEIPGNRPCDTCPQSYRVALMEADGNDSLRRNFQQGGNRGEAGDAWGVSGEGYLTHNTYPSTSRNSGERSSVTIHRIAVENGLAYITLSSRALPSERLLHDFLGSNAPPLTSEEKAHLDAHGNENGVYDVGDLRAYLRR